MYTIKDNKITKNETENKHILKFTFILEATLSHEQAVTLTVLSK